MSAKQVLVVDDEPDVLTATTIMLQCRGFQVHAFADPVKALDHAKDCKDCGIVISDIKMPKMNGFQLARALKKVRPDVKVVLMTALEINRKEWQQTMAWRSR